MYIVEFFRRGKNKFKKIIKSIKIYTRIHPIDYNIKRLGTLYGGWYFALTPSLKSSTVISCGAGEDISFDIDLTSEFKCLTYIVDPTPRAIKHVTSVLKRSGKTKDSNYNNTGSQSIDSYDLSEIKDGQINLIEKALWNEDKNIKFFLPRNPNHVSHSLINFQNEYSNKTDSIEVGAITFAKLIELIELKGNLEILKLDIEGAEHEVICDLINSEILPNQILVEYDELMIDSTRGIKRFKSTHKLLLNSGYKLFAKENTNYSYLRVQG